MLKYLAVALGVITVFSGATPVRPGVPSALVVAAQRPPIEFGMMLASASVTAGLEVREADDSAPGERPTTISSDSGVPLGDVAKAFETHHPEYRAHVMGGVLVIRPKEGAFPFLDTASSIAKPTRVIGVMAAARRVFSVLKPSLLGPILNSFGRPGEDLPIVLDGGGGRRVVETLNQIVVQAPGRVWVVTTRQEQRTVDLISFGFLEAKRRSTQPMPRHRQ